MPAQCSTASPLRQQGKGYTGHESVEHMDIIHMNGRIYYADIGRFLQADPFIQQADNLQNYNRYAYVLNNPMSFTDPSGFFFDKIWDEIKPFVGLIVTVVASYFCAGTCTAAVWSAIGAASGALSSAVNGGKFANGAKSAAFAQILGEASTYATLKSSTTESQVDGWTQADEDWLQETMAQTAIDLENGDVYAYEPGWMRLQERALLDDEFGAGTYTDVMSDAGGVALTGQH